MNLRKPNKSVKDCMAVFIVFAIIGYCCSAEKRVLKDTDKTQRVVNAYLIKHPARIDTFYNYKPGDTVTQLIIGFDTTIVRDTINRRDTVKITETKLKIQTVRDTVVKTIVDNKLLQACQDGLAKVDYDKKQAVLDKQAAENELMRCKTLIAGLIGIIVIIGLIIFIIKQANRRV